ncbi:MAG TPA: AAA family ATPase [Polyangiaceae bacterium]|jgi:energy-coupling factor transporter ATP-binding protein EcfA2|nr:AAA family ATPase [Polyangiaceae bacterium]
MIKSITLQNYRSFGAKQTIPLEPITVLVGPNNSGKSSFISVRRLIQGAIHRLNRGEGAWPNEPYVLRRPPAADGSFHLEWVSDDGSYGTSLRPALRGMQVESEWLRHNERGDAWTLKEKMRSGALVSIYRDGEDGGFGPPPFLGLYRTWGSDAAERKPFSDVLRPLLEAREVKLSLGALRTDAPFENKPALGRNGSNMASIVSLWRSSHPERAEALDAIMRSSIPEIRHVLAMPAPEGQAYRLWFRQTDDQLFDAFHVSDGVLLFTALAMQAIDAGPGSVIFLEEPEHSIHPTRLHDIVELLRRMVHEKGCQFVIATHSPVLLSEFRDEPEAILLFRRGDEGTLVTRLSDVPRLVDALRKADPGEMLSSGFFNDPI